MWKKRKKKKKKRQVEAKESIIANKRQGGACPRTYVLPNVTLQRRQSYKKELL